MRTIRLAAAAAVFLALAHAQTATFPGAVVTDQQLKVVTNNCQTTITAPVGVGDTTILVTNGSCFAANSIGTLDAENISICQMSGNTLTVGHSSCPNTDGRGFDGSTAATHSATSANCSPGTASGCMSLYIDAWHRNVDRKEIEAIESALGANLSNVPVSPLLRAAAYAWAAQSPGGTLSPGSNSVSMTSCPAGLNSYATNASSVYLTAGSGGAAEYALITGGTCLTGIASGTLIVTTANSHGAGWQIQPASFGAQEAINAACASSGGEVILSGGSFQLLAPVSIPCSNITLRGKGGICCSLGTWIHRTFTSGNSFTLGTTAAAVNSINLFDFAISQDINYVTGNPGTISNKPTSGANVEIFGGNTVSIQRVRMENMPVNLLIHGGATITVRDCQFVGLWDRQVSGPQVTSASALIKQDASGAGAGIPTWITFDNDQFLGYLNTSTGKHNVGPYRGLEIDACEDCQVRGGYNGGANSAGLYIYANGSHPLLNIKVSGVDFDSAYDADVILTGDGTTSASGIQIGPQNTFDGELQEDNAIQVPNLGSGSPPFYGLTIKENDIYAQLASGISIQDGTGLFIAANSIRYYNASNTYTAAAQTSAMYFAGRATKVQTRGNILGGDLSYSNYGSGANYCKYGISSSGLAANALRTFGDYAPYYAAIQNYNTVDFSTRMFSYPGETLQVGSQQSVSGAVSVACVNDDASSNIPCEFRGSSYWLGLGPTSTAALNVIASETGATNAIAGCLTNISLGSGLVVRQFLGHSLQAGANTYNYCAGGAVAIKSHRNTANNIGVAYASGGYIELLWDGTQWEDASQ